MDKRWILILIILIVGLACMYAIVDSSNTVGNAITVLNKSVVTLPDDFGIGNTEKNSVELIGKNDDEKVYIEDFGKKDIALELFKDNLSALSHKSEFKILKNTTESINNITVYKIYLQDCTTENITNVTMAYIYSNNHTFMIKITGSNQSNMEKNLNFLVSTIQPDYKQSQD